VWEAYINPKHIINWNFAWDDWSCPKAENNLVVWWKLLATMAARDGSMSFEFEWEYTKIVEYKNIDFTILDMQYGDQYLKKWRKVSLTFTDLWDKVVVTEIFDSEELHSLEMQKQGWQMILDRFKNYVESL
jgi:uncharacterized protein YndB with AHSA1/START domain